MILINVLLKFSLIGIIGVVINFLITFLLKEYLKVYKYVSNSFGYLIAISFNFLANKFFTFKSDNSKIYDEVIKFIIVTSIGILINHIIVYLLREKKYEFLFFKNCSRNSGIHLEFHITFNFYI